MGKDRRTLSHAAKPTIETEPASGPVDEPAGMPVDEPARPKPKPKATGKPVGQATTKHKMTLTLNADTAERLAVVANVMGVDPCDIVERLIGPLVRKIRMPSVPDEIRTHFPEYIPRRDQGSPVKSTGEDITEP